jgi:hypothetical protein
MGLDAVVSAVISGFLKRLCAGDSDEGLNCPLNTRNDAKEIKATEEKMPFRVVGALRGPKSSLC